MLLANPTNAAGWPAVATVVSHMCIASYAATYPLASLTRNVEARSGRMTPGGQFGTTPGIDEELGQYRQHRLVEHRPVVDLVAVLPRDISGVLLEFDRGVGRQPSRRRRGQPELGQRPCRDRVVYPRRQGEVVDRDQRFQVMRAQGVEHVAVMLDLVLLGQRVQRLQVATLTVPPSSEISTDAVEFGKIRLHSMLIRNVFMPSSSRASAASLSYLT